MSEDPTHLLEIAVSELTNKNPAKAIEIFNHLISTGQAPPSVYYGKSLALLKLNELSEALNNLNQFIYLCPGNKDALSLADAITLRAPNLQENGEIPLIYNQIVPVKEYLSKNTNYGAIHQLSNIEVKNGQPQLVIGEVNDGCILGRYALISSIDGHIFRESTIYSHTSEAINGVYGRKFSPSNLTYLKGEYATLWGLWGDGFWHWMMEWLQKAVILEEFGFKGKYIVYKGNHYIDASLELIGITRDRIIYHDNRNYRVEKLFVPPAICGSDLGNFPGALNCIRRALVKGATGRVEPSGNRRIYIPRRNQKSGRTILNEVELLTLLQKFNFEVSDMDNLSLKEQLETVASASVLIGPHGSGFFHTLVMPEKSLVIELYSPHYLNPCNIPIYRHLKHRYFTFTASVPLTREADRNDIIADLALIEMTLERELTQ